MSTASLRSIGIRLSLLALIGGITLMYILASELAKRLFYRHVAW